MTVPSAATATPGLPRKRMLSSVTDPAGIEGFMNDQLGTLLDYDKRHRSDLLATLAQYFDSGCNIDQAAAVLAIHRSTLKYRLKRVRELLGQDLNDGSTRLDLHLATRVWLAPPPYAASPPSRTVSLANLLARPQPDAQDPTHIRPALPVPLNWDLDLPALRVYL